MAGSLQRILQGRFSAVTPLSQRKTTDAGDQHSQRGEFRSSQSKNNREKPDSRRVEPYHEKIPGRHRRDEAGGGLGFVRTDEQGTRNVEPQAFVGTCSWHVRF